MALGLLLFAVGCTPASDPSAPPLDTGASTEPPTVTVTVPTDPPTTSVTGTISASCAIAADNGLRGVCSAVFPVAATAVLTLSLGDEAPLTFTADAPGAEVTLPFWGLVADTSWRWHLSAREDPALYATGSLVAGAVVGTLTGLDVAIDAPGPHGDEFVLFNYGCQTFEEALIAIDRLGRIRWYQPALAAPVVPPVATFRSLNTSEDGGVLALLDRNHAVHWGFDGSVRLLSSRFQQFDPPVHHEVTARGDYLYVLFAEETALDGIDYVTDGFLVLDGAGAVVATWHMADHLPPTPAPIPISGYWADLFPGAVDWSHSNALAVDEALNVTISVRYQHALVQVVGDPAAPDFGRVAWVVASSDSEGLTSTIPYVSTAGLELDFAEQHHVVASAPGELTLWDNGDDSAGESRALRFTTDGAALDLVQEWRVGDWCPGQGSASVLASGNALVDCAPSDRIAEVTAAGDTVWSAELSCGVGFMLRPLYRGLPIDLFPASP